MAPRNDDLTRDGNPWRISLALVLVAAGLFWPALSFDFVNYDDPVFVTQNDLVLGGLTWAGIQRALTSLYIYWQPLTWISYMVDVEISALSPKVFRTTNLLFHLGSSALLFLALRRMTQSPWRSAVASALFAVHPLHVETVVWISERKGVLCGFFFHLALYLYACHAARPRWTTNLAVTCAFALSLMSKSLSVTFPFLLLLLDAWPLRRIASSKTSSDSTSSELTKSTYPTLSWGRLVLEKVPMIALAAASSLLTMMAQKRMGAMMGTDLFSVSDRIAIALTSYTAYLKKFFIPNDLAVFYPNPGKWPAVDVAIAALVVIGITSWTLFRRTRSPYLAVGWLWFLGMILPVSGLLQTGEQVMADRYTYLALTGLAIYTVWAAGELLQTLRVPAMAMAASGAAAILLAMLFSKSQIETWQNTKSLFTQAHSVTKDNYLADTVLGTELTQEGRFEEALAHFNSALRVQPRYAETHYRMGLTLVAMKRFPEAIARLNQALSVDPANADILSGLATAMHQGGDLSGAANVYEKAIQARPRSIALRHQLAKLRHQQGDYSRAVAGYREVLSAKPDQPEVLNNLAWILATHEQVEFRNGTEAVTWAERAVQLTTRKSPVLLGTLAAAYAEAGRFEDALKTSEEARQLALAAGQADIARRNAELGTNYQSRKPWREKTP